MMNFIGIIREAYLVDSLWGFRETWWCFSRSYALREDRIEFMKMQLMGGEPYYFNRGDYE